MRCREFERRLDAIIGDRVPAELRHEAERHMAECASCHELHEMAIASLVAPATSGIDLVGAVLSRTSGPACDAACDRLADMADGALADADRDLVLSHLGGCPACAALADTLSWMSTELPALARIDPGEEFTRSVLRATAGALSAARARENVAAPAPARAPALMPSLLIAPAWWTRLTQRPRFSWEAAYVAAIAAWLLFGAAFAPFRQVPGRALDLARVNPVGALVDAVEPASLGAEIWGATGGRVARRAEASAGAVTTRASGLREATGSMAGHGAELMGAILRGDLSTGAMRLEEMSDDVKRLWDILWRPDRPLDTKDKGQEA